VTIEYVVSDEAKDEVEKLITAASIRFENWSLATFSSSVITFATEKMKDAQEAVREIKKIIKLHNGTIEE